MNNNTFSHVCNNNITRIYFKSGNMIEITSEELILDNHKDVLAIYDVCSVCHRKLESEGTFSPIPMSTKRTLILGALGLMAGGVIIAIIKGFASIIL